MNLDNMTIGELKEINSILGNKSSNDSHWKLGKPYFIRTVTHHFTGNLVLVTDKELVFNKVAWIADDGRLTDALEKCEFNEVEIYPDGEVIIGRGALIDASILKGELPKKQK